MLSQLLFNNPQGALDLAKGLVSAEGGPLIDIQATAEAFLSNNHVQETTAFLLEALKDNKEEHSIPSLYATSTNSSSSPTQTGTSQESPCQALFDKLASPSAPPLHAVESLTQPTNNKCGALHMEPFQTVSPMNDTTGGKILYAKGNNGSSSSSTMEPTHTVTPVKVTTSDGKKEGKGTYQSVNGEVYEGDWENDMKHGNGRMKCNNGSIRDDLWEEDDTSFDSELAIASIEDNTSFDSELAIASIYKKAMEPKSWEEISEKEGKLEPEADVFWEEDKKKMLEPKTWEEISEKEGKLEPEADWFWEEDRILGRGWEEDKKKALEPKTWEEFFEKEGKVEPEADWSYGRDE